MMVIMTPLIIKSQPGGQQSGPGDDDTATTPNLCDIDGADSTYSETIDGELRIITASGCPNVSNDIKMHSL